MKGLDHLRQGSVQGLGLLSLEGLHHLCKSLVQSLDHLCKSLVQGVGLGLRLYHLCENGIGTPNFCAECLGVCVHIFELFRVWGLGFRV